MSETEKPYEAKFSTFSRNRLYPPAMPRYPRETVINTCRALEELMVDPPKNYSPPFLDRYTQIEAEGVFDNATIHINNFLNALNIHKKENEAIHSTYNRLQNEIIKIERNGIEQIDMIDIKLLSSGTHQSSRVLTIGKSKKNADPWPEDIHSISISAYPHPIPSIYNNISNILLWESFSGYYPNFFKNPNPFKSLLSIYEAGIYNIEFTNINNEEKLKATTRLEENSKEEKFVTRYFPQPTDNS